MPFDTICVYSGSSLGTDPVYADSATALGTMLASKGIRLVYGGGGVGLMGQVANAAMDSGGEVIGVIPRGLFQRDVANHHITELREVHSMHERKQLMYELADAFVALPGGLGTLEELAEITTWAQLGLHRKPIALFDIKGYWRPILDFLDHSVAAGFVKAENRDLLVRVDTLDDLLPALEGYEPPVTEKWIDETQT